MIMFDNKLSLLINKLKLNFNLKNHSIWIIALLIYIFFIKNAKFYILLNNIISISILIAFIYVSIIKAKFVDKIFIKKIEIVYVVSIIIIILNIIGIWVSFSERYIYYLLILHSVQSSLEYCQIQNIFKFQRYIFKNVLVYLSHSVVLIVALLTLKLHNIDLNNSKLLFLILVILNILVNCGIGLSTLRRIVKNRHDFNNIKLKRIYFYMVSIIINYVGLIALLKGNEKIAVFIIIIKCNIFYGFYDYIISKILENSLKKIKENIKLATKTKKELNSILKKRNIILKDTNIMIQKSEDKYNKLINSIYGAVFLFSADKLQYVNKKTLKLFKVNNDEIVGLDLRKFISRFFCVNLDDIKKSQNYISSVKMKDTNIDVEIFLVQVDFETKLLYVHDVTQVNENKKIIKEFEEYLKEDELKKEFFANISHELKTPINLIFSALQVNQIYLKENNIKGLRKNRKIIKQNCLRLIRTINNFIDANKVSEGYMISHRKIHNIVELVENVSIACNKYIKLIKNTLTFDSEEEEIFVDCDKEMITRIILNILSNSVKYGKKNGNIDVNIFIEDETNVGIRIKNDGLKIDEKTIPYIFDKFTKLNKAFNRIKEGSGLGMFLTKALVELQGGKIKLITNNSGNEFIITFPMIKDANNVYMHEELEINQLEEKVDVEFSDIYIE